MKKFFVVIVMVIAMTTGLVGQAFASDVTLDGIRNEDLDKIEELADGWVYLVNHSKETGQYRLVSSTIRYVEYSAQTGYKYEWTATVYDMETNEYRTDKSYIIPSTIDIHLKTLREAIELL